MEATMSDNGVYARLAERFAPEDHKTKSIGGTNLTYVDGETVISRLNEVLGWDGWSFEIKETHVLENEVWVAGRLTVYSGERTVVREQTGGQIINRKRTGEIIELSNDIKGASTDCLKKCATLVGIGLYLYDPVERKEVEQDMREAKRAPKPAADQPKQPTPMGRLCDECHSLVKAPSIEIQKNQKGDRVTVPVDEFEPVCVARLGAFHCGDCYDRKFWKKGAA